MSKNTSAPDWVNLAETLGNPETPAPSEPTSNRTQPTLATAWPDLVLHTDFDPHSPEVFRILEPFYRHAMGLGRGTWALLDDPCRFQGTLQSEIPTKVEIPVGKEHSSGLFTASKKYAMYLRALRVLGVVVHGVINELDHRPYTIKIPALWTLQERMAFESTLKRPTTSLSVTRVTIEHESLNNGHVFHHKIEFDTPQFLRLER